ncbi:MAG: cation:proton antiporter, partial [Longimicrobiales bacterium]
MTGVAILLLGAAAAYGFARWLDVSAVPFLVLAGVLLARLDLFPAALLQDAVVLGLTFVLFVAGTELNPTRVRDQRPIALRVGLLQFLALGALGTLLALLLRFPTLTAVYLGLALAASSTLVIVRLLQRRRQLFEPFGRLVVGVLLLQDLLVILMIPLLIFAPLGIEGVLRGLAGTIALVGLSYICLRWVTPRLAVLRMEPEPLLLCALALLSLFIGLAHLLELPLAAGAFLAGVALSPFPVRGIIRGQLTSIGDFFSAIFFIALGGLIDPPTARVAGQAALFILLMLMVTPPIVIAVTQRAGFTTRAGLESGLLLAQTSELSLVLALQGMIAGQLSRDTFTMLVIVTVATMVLTPWLSSERVVQKLTRLLPGRRQPAAHDVPQG